MEGGRGLAQPGDLVLTRLNAARGESSPLNPCPGLAGETDAGGLRGLISSQITRPWDTGMTGGPGASSRVGTICGLVCISSLWQFALSPGVLGQGWSW